MDFLAFTPDYKKIENLFFEQNDVVLHKQCSGYSTSIYYYAEDLNCKGYKITQQDIDNYLGDKWIIKYFYKEPQINYNIPLGIVAPKFIEIEFRL
jgi:hypothetical protein